MIPLSYMMWLVGECADVSRCSHTSSGGGGSPSLIVDTKLSQREKNRSVTDFDYCAVQWLLPAPGRRGGREASSPAPRTPPLPRLQWPRALKPSPPFLLWVVPQQRSES